MREGLHQRFGSGKAQTDPRSSQKIQVGFERSTEVRTVIHIRHFRCDECQRNFTQKIHLRKHLEKHHPEIDFEYTQKEEAGTETLIKVEELAGGGKIIFTEEYEVIEEEMDSLEK